MIDVLLIGLGSFALGVLVAAHWMATDVAFWRERASFWAERTQEARCDWLAALTGATRSDVSRDLEGSTQFIDIDALPVQVDEAPRGMIQ